MIRLRTDGNSITYAQRRTTEGKTQREILRCLKRYIAREVYKLLVKPPAVHNGADLRRQRTQHGLALTDIAYALDTTPTRISQLERGRTHNNHLAEHYQHHLSRIPEIPQISGCQT